MDSGTEKVSKPKARLTRTTVTLPEDDLEKLKILAWWENKTIKDLFDEMIQQYLSSHTHLDGLIEERRKKKKK